MAPPSADACSPGLEEAAASENGPVPEGVELRFPSWNDVDREGASADPAP